MVVPGPEGARHHGVEGAMKLVGLTGGIGSGKSTVAGMLERRGAVILDADHFARDAVASGTDGFRRVVGRFGTAVVGPDGEIDRPALAAIVFADRSALDDLEAIVHPEVRRAMTDAMSAHVRGDGVVVLVNPLLIEMGTHRDCDLVVVVSATPATQVARAVRRGLTDDDVKARIASQLPLEERAKHADVLIDNEGSLDELETQVERVWHRLHDGTA